LTIVLVHKQNLQDTYIFFLVFQKAVFRKTRKLQKAAKILVFIFESFDILNIYFNLIGESVEKIWLIFSDPWWKIRKSLGPYCKSTLRITIKLFPGHRTCSLEPISKNFSYTTGHQVGPNDFGNLNFNSPGLFRL
jgi:hypothetical protein